MITVDDLKAELTSYNYQMLTQNDDSIAQRAIEKADIWVKAKFAKCGKEPDFEDSLVKEATLKRALYELYSWAEQEEKAKDKKEDAEALLEGIIGSCAKEGSGSSVPYVAVAKSSSDWKGFE
ncbi:hypothetical protein [Desulfurobacterium sp.]